MNTLEKDVIDAWEACPARDQEAKDYYWQLYKNCKKLRGILVAYVNGGKAALLDKPESKVKQFFGRNSAWNKS